MATSSILGTGIGEGVDVVLVPGLEAGAGPYESALAVGRIADK